MIYFLSVLLVLQLAVILWLVSKNLDTFAQSPLQDMLAEIDLLKQEEERLDEEIRLQKEEILAQRDAIMEIHQKAYPISILVGYKQNLLKKNS